MEHNSVISIRNVKKSFGEVTAVNNLSLSVRRGEVYALIGENGAGKTTLIKLIVGLLTPDAGQVSLNGIDYKDDPEMVKQQFGYLPDDPSAYEYLTGYEFMEFTARLRNMEDGYFDKRLKELERMFPITNVLSQQIGNYSRGSKQKVAFLAMLLSEPEILVIDEPIVGLDPISIEIFGKTIRQYAERGHTVLFVTHILDFAEKYATRIGLMKNGQLLQEENPTKISVLRKFLK